MPDTDREAARLMELIEIVKEKLDEICRQAETFIAAAKGADHNAS